MKSLKNKFALPLVGFITVIGATFVLSPLALASNASVTLNVNPSCVSTANDAVSTTTNVTTGSTVSVYIFNENGVTDQNVSGPGVPAGTLVQKDNKASTNNPITLSLGPINSQTTITFTPLPNNDPGVVTPNNCPTGSSPQSSYLVLNPVDPPPPAASSSPSSTSASKGTTVAPAATSTPGASAPTTPKTAAKVSASATTITVSSKESSKTPWIIGLVLLALLAAGAWFMYKKGKLPVAKKPKAKGKSKAKPKSRRKR